MFGAYKKFLLLTTLLLLNSCFFNKTSIVEISSISQAHDVLAKADTKTLVIFDCDNTLIIPADKVISSIRDQEQFLKTELGKKILGEWSKHVASKQDPLYEKRVREKIFAKARYKPVEATVGDEIKNLQSRGIKVVALTAQETGNPDDLQHSTAHWRFEKLRSIGIDLSSSFQTQEIVFKSLPDFHGAYPVFYHGILCTSLLTPEKNVPKGDVLGAFLDVIAFKPERVIFFDDRPEHLDSVAQEMKKRSIDFCGYLYKAIDRVQVTEPDPKIAAFQLEYLIKHEEWLTDEEAAQMMDKK